MFKACLATLAFVVAALGHAAQGQAVDPRIKAVTDDWDKRRGALKSVRYTTEGVFLMFREPMVLSMKEMSFPSETFPAKDISFPEKRVLLLDFERQRHRFEVESSSYIMGKDRIEPHKAIYAFDGQKLQGLNHNGVYGTVEGANRRATFLAEIWPLFYGHGVVPHSTAPREIFAGDFLTKVDPELLDVFGEGVHEGRRCLILRSRAWKGVHTIFDEFWVDPARQSALVRHVTYSQSKVAYDRSIQYQQVGGHWLPGSWTFVSRNYLVNLTEFEQRIRVTNCEVDLAVSESDFQVPPAKGSLFRESRYVLDDKTLKTKESEIRYYRIDNSGARKEVVIVDGREEYVNFWLRQTTRRVFAGVVVALVFAAAIGVGLKLRSRIRTEKKG